MQINNKCVVYVQQKYVPKKHDKPLKSNMSLYVIQCYYTNMCKALVHKQPHRHRHTLVGLHQPWWLGELWLADCWKPGPMRSACLWLVDRSILSCWGRQKQEAKRKKKNKKKTNNHVTQVETFLQGQTKYIFAENSSGTKARFIFIAMTSKIEYKKITTN